MKTRFSLAVAICAVPELTARSATAEVLGVATFVPPQHHASTRMFAWLGEGIEWRSGGSLTMKLHPVRQLGAGLNQQYKRVVEVVFGVAARTAAIFPKSMLAILLGKAGTADQSTRAIREVFDEHLADECGDVKVLAVGTVAGNPIAATRDVSTMKGLKGAKLVPCMSLPDGHRATIDELAGLQMSLELAKSFDGADDRAKIVIAEADKGCQWTVESDEERAKMDAAEQKGLHTIFADYESKGVANAREVNEALNQWNFGERAGKRMSAP